MENLELKILQEFHKRAPNPLAIADFDYLFDQMYSQDEIEKSFLNLEKQNKLLKRHKLNSNLDLEQYKQPYDLPADLSRPFTKYIILGKTKIPRIIAGDLISSESSNMISEALVKYTDELTERYQNQVKKYWGNIITIFGLFLAIFTLISSSLNKIEINSSISYKEVFMINFVQIIPTAIVLLGFIVLLKVFFINNIK